MKTLAALLAAAAGLILALDSADVVVMSTRVIVAAIVVSASLAAVATIAGAWAEWRQRRLGARRDLADVQLTATLWAIVDLVGSGLDYRDLGLAVYRVERLWWWPFARRLRRMHRVRASRRPVASRVNWKPGKGVIGACVTRGEVVAYDVGQMYDNLGELSAEEWNQLPADVRLGLGYAEYRDVRDKYDVVVASPVIDDLGVRSQVRGCVALDGPTGRLAELTTDEVLSLLNSAGSGLLSRAA